MAEFAPGKNGKNVSIVHFELIYDTSWARMLVGGQYNTGSYIYIYISRCVCIINNKIIKPQCL